MDRLDSLLKAASENLEKGSLWRAYVSVESAILDVKMRHGLELEAPPTPPKRTAKKDDLLADARLRLSQIDVGSEKRKLLFDLRACRDALKAALAKS